MHIVLEMSAVRLMHVGGEMFVSRCAGDSDDDPGADDFLAMPSYGNCDVELTFDDLWDDDGAEPTIVRRGVGRRS